MQRVKILTRFKDKVAVALVSIAQGHTHTLFECEQSLGTQLTAQVIIDQPE